MSAVEKPMLALPAPGELVTEIPPLQLSVDNYFAHKRIRLTAASERGYRATLRAFVAFFPTQTLKAFEPPAGTHLLEDFLVTQWGDLSPRTYNKVVRVGA